MVRAEGDDDPLRVPGGSPVPDLVRAGSVGVGLALDVQPGGARQRLQPREGDMLAGLAANAGLQQLVAPVALPQGFARAGDGFVGGQRRRTGGVGFGVRVELVEGLHHRGGNRLHGERPGDAGLGAVDVRLVVEGDGIGRFVISQDPRRYVLDTAVSEPGPDPLVGPGQLVVVVARGHQPLPRDGHRHPRGVADRPPSPPLFRDISGGAGTAGGVEHQIARVRGHQDATLDGLRGGLDDVTLVARRHRRGPDVGDPPAWYLVLVLFPPQRGLPFQRLQPVQAGEPVHALPGNPPLLAGGTGKDTAVPLVRIGAAGRGNTGRGERHALVEARVLRQVSVRIEAFLGGGLAALPVGQFDHDVPTEELDHFAPRQRLV